MRRGLAAKAGSQRSDETAKGPQVSHVWNRTVIIAALGYFVDIYDLILFSVVRVESLRGIGVADDALLDVGGMLLNWQMIGFLVGGVLWGVLGDKRGRVSVLFGSILLYSTANLANAFVDQVPGTDPVTLYAILRFVAGVGLAGELGAAITLVSEVMTKESRGYGAAVVAALGILGGLAAVAVAGLTDWRVAYIIGGLLGFALLGARFSMRDSGLFAGLARANVARGAFTTLFTNRDRLRRYTYSLLVGTPIWFVVGILVTFSPELAPAIGVTGPVSAGIAVLWTYVGLSAGDLGSGLLSGYLRSRKWVLIGFLAFTSGLIFLYTMATGLSPSSFYLLCFALGLGIGYWAVFNINAAEQFGTNLRATVATTAPNFVRGSLVPINLAFRYLADRIGLVLAALLVGQATILIALFSVRMLKETYGTDLDFVETDEAPSTTDQRSEAEFPVGPGRAPISRA